MAVYTLLNGYVGSKQSYASKIKALFDDSCTKYVEPYAGAALFFSIYNGRYSEEWLNDLNPNIVSLYRALRDEDTREETIQAIREIEKPDNRELACKHFAEARKHLLTKNIKIKSLTKESLVHTARNSFLVYTQSFNCGGKSYTANKSNEKYQWETKRNLTNAVERLTGLPHITQMDGVDVVKKVKEKSEAQLFCDPPYVGLYRNCTNLYATEMSSLQKHIELAQELADARAAVVLCGYRAQEGIPTIYDTILGEQWHCFKLADTVKQCEVVSKGITKQPAQEFVWTNRVPKRAALYLSMQDYKEAMSLEEYWERIRAACADKLVPDRHIKEYSKTFKELYGKDLLD